MKLIKEGITPTLMDSRYQYTLVSHPNARGGAFSMRWEMVRVFDYVVVYLIGDEIRT